MDADWGLALAGGLIGLALGMTIGLALLALLFERIEGDER